MKGLRKVLQNSVWMAAEQIVRMIAGLFIGIWIARQLGSNDYGALNLALALSSLVGIFGTLGLTRTVVRELALNVDDKVFARRMVATTLAWRLVCSLICYVGTVAICLIYDQGRPLLVGIVAATIAFSSFDVIDLYFQSKAASHHCVMARSMSFFVFLCVKVVLLLNNASVVFFAVATTLEAMCNALALWIAGRSYGNKIRLQDVDMRYGWTLIGRSWPELFAGFACIVFMRIDQIMLGNMLGDTAVGQYSVASRLAESWYFIPSVLVASSFPGIVRQRARNKTLYLKRIRQLMVVLVAASYLVAALAMFCAPWVIKTLFGSAYKDSAAILVILVWSGLFVSLGTVSGSWIIAESKPMLNLTRNTYGAVANIAFNFYLIPRYGTVGAAVGTLLSLSLAYLVCDFFNPQTRPIGILKIKALLLIWK